MARRASKIAGISMPMYTSKADIDIGANVDFLAFF